MARCSSVRTLSFPLPRAFPSSPYLLFVLRRFLSFVPSRLRCCSERFREVVAGFGPRGGRHDRSLRLGRGLSRCLPGPSCSPSPGGVLMRLRLPLAMSFCALLVLASASLAHAAVYEPPSSPSEPELSGLPSCPSSEKDSSEQVYGPELTELCHAVVGRSDALRHTLFWVLLELVKLRESQEASAKLLAEPPSSPSECDGSSCSREVVAAVDENGKSLSLVLWALFGGVVALFAAWAVKEAFFRGT